MADVLDYEGSATPKCRISRWCVIALFALSLNALVGPAVYFAVTRDVIDIINVGRWMLSGILIVSMTAAAFAVVGITRSVKRGLGRSSVAIGYFVLSSAALIAFVAVFAMA